MARAVIASLAFLTFYGCGLGETAVTATAGSASEIEQAKEGLKTEARVKQQLDAAAAVDAERRRAAEASSQ